MRAHTFSLFDRCAHTTHTHTQKNIPYILLRAHKKQAERRRRTKKKKTISTTQQLDNVHSCQTAALETHTKNTHKHPAPHKAKSGIMIIFRHHRQQQHQYLPPSTASTSQSAPLTTAPSQRHWLNPPLPSETTSALQHLFSLLLFFCCFFPFCRRM